MTYESIYWPSGANTQGIEIIRMDNNFNEIVRNHIGDDWEYIPGQESIVSLGGKLVKIRYSPDYSTSSTISKISGSVTPSPGRLSRSNALQDY